MEIIEIPHPTLRQVSAPVAVVDKKLLNFVNDLHKTLASTRKPKGGGLAAPQVDKLWRIFVTRIGKPRVFINPVIINHSKEKQSRIDEIMEGCLSIPKMWGEVPRWTWIEMEFDEIKGDKLVRTKERFENVLGVFIQHEVDHLDGILFTDHSLEYNLPVFQEQEDGKFIEVDKEFLEII